MGRITLFNCIFAFRKGLLDQFEEGSLQLSHATLDMGVVTFDWLGIGRVTLLGECSLHVIDRSLRNGAWTH